MVKQVSGGFRRFDHERVRLEFDEPSLTHQNFAAACDIRNIMAQYKRTGVIQHLTSATRKNKVLDIKLSNPAIMTGVEEYMIDFSDTLFKG